MTTAERYEFLQLCHRRRYKKGEYIYYMGDPGTGMYVLEEGKVLLSLEKDEKEAYENIPSYEINKTDCFGALSVIYEMRRRTSARCLTDVKVLGFFRPDYETLRNRHPLIAIKFLENVASTSLKLLEKTTDKLIKATNTSEAFSIQVETSIVDNNP
ncbi:MAG TPA: cyclic nucleotide-binding domain-containing protein [Balneolales bacterium]|nr:cyclic nucleotide-binding domain-containing protein [Balneolales bacterium]